MPRIRTGLVKVDGLAELNRSFKDMHNGMQADLKAASKDVADDVRRASVGAAYSIGGVAAHVAPSLSSVATPTSAAVAGGGASYAMFGGAEFGSNRYKQFRPWRGNGMDAGYFVYPSIRANSDLIVQKYTAAADHILEKARLK